MANINDVGLFLQTTYEFDISQIQQLNSNPELKRLFERLYKNVNDIVLSLNKKETGYYTVTEFVTGKLWYPNPLLSSTTSQTPVFRQAFRKTIRFGALLNNATKSVPHGITIGEGFRLKIIDCVANRPKNIAGGILWSGVPIPYVSTLQPIPESIEIFIDEVNINIATTSVVTNWTQYTDVDVILEYVKQ